MTRSTAEKLFTTSLLLITAGALWMTRDWLFKVYLFPRVVETGVLILLIAHLISLFLRPSKQHEDGNEADPVDVDPAKAKLERFRWLSMLAWLLVFVASIVLIGFPAGGTLATLVYLRLVAKEGWPVTVGVSLGVAMFFWATANPKLMGVPYSGGLVAPLLPEWLQNMRWWPK